MKNMMNYVQEFGKDSFDERPFSEIDALVLTELGYSPLEEIASSDMSGKEFSTIEEIAHYMGENAERLLRDNPMMITQERVDLTQEIGKAKRYQSLKFFGMKSEVDSDITKQFAAFTVEIKPNVRIVIYRGTDETLIGWKEDFMMTYSPIIPAHKDAKEYLEQQAKLFDGEILLSGHSKGGNLALYAASTQEKEVQSRLGKIFCFDSPGLHRSILEMEGYHAVVPLAMRYIPQDALVGLLLESEIPYVIVKSNAFAALQHSALTWEIENGQFVTMDHLTKNSQLNDQTFKKWTEEVSDEELELFWDVFFELLFTIGLDTINDVFGKFMHYVQEFFKAAGQMDEEKRELLTRVALLLLQTRFDVWRASISFADTFNIEFPSWDDILTSIHWKKEGISITYQASQENEEIREYYQHRHEQKKHEEK